MTELIKIGLLYLIFAITAIFATNSHKSILQKLKDSKNKYIKYMDDIAEDKIQNSDTTRFSNIRLGVGL